jgi:glycosyltransferase involved in cell wall biosynthesis
MRARRRIAFVVSHPIQYLAPLYQKLAGRDDVEVKVFFTWHAGQHAVDDRGFGRPIAWDIPLTDGYDFELVANIASDPGTHKFLGLRNPMLLDRVISWQPDVVHINGWAWLSHLQLLHALNRRGVPTLFFGDSHLLDAKTSGPRWWLKSAVLRQVYSWPTACLFTGSANRAYFETFGVPPQRLYPCPHSIDVSRFADAAMQPEAEAARWRSELGIAREQKVLLFAGKFDANKRPAQLMRTVAKLHDGEIVLVLVGAGELQAEIDAIAASDPARFRVLPFQNQSRMPIVYRLGDIFIMPSSAETWGIAVNEALACGRPVVVSDGVGCAADVVDITCGRIFRRNDWSALGKVIEELKQNGDVLAAMGRAAATRGWVFDVAATETALLAAVNEICTAPRHDTLAVG